MNKCTNCNIFIDKAHTKCPLCQRNLQVQDSSDNPWYPNYTDILNDPPKRPAFKALVFSALVVCGICFFINFLTGIESWWSLVVFICVLYSLILIKHILSHTNIISKIVLQIIGLSALFLTINALTGGVYWSLYYALPFLTTISTYAIWIIIKINKTNWLSYTGSFILLIILGFIPLILFILGISNVVWTAVMAALNAILTIAGLLIFTGKAFRSEVFRKFIS